MLIWLSIRFNKSVDVYRSNMDTLRDIANSDSDSKSAQRMRNEAISKMRSQKSSMESTTKVFYYGTDRNS